MQRTKDHHEVTSQWCLSIDVEATWCSKYFSKPGVVVFCLKLDFSPKMVFEIHFGFYFGIHNEAYLSGTTKWLRLNFKNWLVFLILSILCFYQFLPLDMGSNMFSQEARSKLFQLTKFPSYFKAHQNFFEFIWCKIHSRLALAQDHVTF